jgi:hypothetical protein
MFLEYGVNTNGDLVHISQSPQGRVPLMCPYCGRGLLARKGQQLEHHFAHDGETCRAATRDFEVLDLPLFDRFNIYIRASAWEQLQRFHGGGYYAANTRLLLDADLITERIYGKGGRYTLTDYGKIPFGEATATAFSRIQDQMVEKRHDTLTNPVELAYFGHRAHRGFRNYAPRTIYWSLYPKREIAALALTDLNIYRQQVHRAYSRTLYLLLITHSTGELYKIGVTNRDVAERIEEVHRDLQPHLTIKKIEAIRLLNQRGAVERYLHHRYREQRVSISTHLEYFSFDANQRRNLLSEYTRLGDYAPTQPSIVSILRSEVSSIEKSIREYHEMIDDAHEEALHSTVVREGMQRAKDRGLHVGRPSEDNTVILSKYPQVIDALNQGLSLRKAASAAKVAINTVRKIKALLDSQ